MAFGVENKIYGMAIPAEVKKDIAFTANTLLQKFGENIGKIILFGSYATGKYQPDSDIDIAVSLKILPEIKQRRQYTEAVDIDRELDLLFCSGEQLLSNEYVYGRINEQGVVLYEQL
ncbi:MAG: nucleotidyltransferase domain-containing protein [Oscillospiraceae bacterium]|nr:nucleotidyltransferase domain-containing protein [Oscillospiraceae bacterium]